MKFEYGKTELPNGYYVVSINGNKTIAEWLSGDWCQLGIDYDHWQYSSVNFEIEVIAEIDIQTMEFKQESVMNHESNSVSIRGSNI